VVSASSTRLIWGEKLRRIISRKREKRDKRTHLCMRFTWETIRMWARMKLSHYKGDAPSVQE
jgi:hypothetical protein